MEIVLDRTAPGIPHVAAVRTNEFVLSNVHFARLVAVLLSILHVALGLTATLDKSPTYDEPTHLTAGYSYWLRGDFRLDTENGNLPARWAALPLLLTRPNFVAPNDTFWTHVAAFRASNKFFYHSGNNPERMLLQARAMMSILSGLLCLLIFFCAQRLFGIAGGLIAETVAVFDPNLLANGALVTSDVTSTLFFLAAIWTTWNLFHRVSVRTFLLSAGSISGLFLSKMSGPIFLPMAAILACVAIFHRGKLEVQIGRLARTISGKPGKLFAIGLCGLALIAISAIAIWAAFNFRFSALADSGKPREILDWRWDFFVKTPSAATRLVAFARDHHLLPEAYLYGLLFTEGTANGRPAFLDGRSSNVGFRSFFPRAFLYKTPIPIVCLLLLSVAAACVRWKQCSDGSLKGFSQIAMRDCVGLAPVWTLLVVYSAVAMQSGLNIGFRHLLPIYAALFIACGASARFFQKERTRLGGFLVGAILTWHVSESFFVRPDYLAYFNQFAGGSANGYKHLVDSSLDWGQDLPGLKTWLEAQPTSPHVYLSYFGVAEPTWYRIRATQLPENGAGLSPLEPGLYCISATVLQHVYEAEQGKWAVPYENAYQNALRRIQSPARTTEDVATYQRLRFGRLCAYLRHRRSFANIGYSILVFRLTADDLRHALDGPPTELAPSIEVASD